MQALIYCRGLTWYWTSALWCVTENTWQPQPRTPVFDLVSTTLTVARETLKIALTCTRLFVSNCSLIFTIICYVANFEVKLKTCMFGLAHTSLFIVLLYLFFPFDKFSFVLCVLCYFLKSHTLSFLLYLFIFLSILHVFTSSIYSHFMFLPYLNYFSMTLTCVCFLKIGVFSLSSKNILYFIKLLLLLYIYYSYMYSLYPIFWLLVMLYIYLV